LLQPRACYGRFPWAVACYAVYLYVVLLALALQAPTYPGGLYLPEVWILFFKLLLWVLFFWAVSNLMRNDRVRRAAFTALILGCVIRAALPLTGLARTAHVQGSGGARVTALGQTANQSAQVLAVGLLALIGLAFVQHRGGFRPRILAWAAVALIAIGMVETGSRGGMVILSLGLLVYSATGRSLGARVRNAAVVLLALAVLIFAVARSDVMRGRLEMAREGSFSQREKIFPLELAMIREKPILGWGPITNKYELALRIRDSIHTRRDAHNILLEILTATGIAGLIPFLLGTWLCLLSAWRARAGPYGVVPLAILLAVLAGNMSENRIAGPVLWFVLAQALAADDDTTAERDALT
jgi:O-antigen ligase